MARTAKAAPTSGSNAIAHRTIDMAAAAQLTATQPEFCRSPRHLRYSKVTAPTPATDPNRARRKDVIPAS
jgi:hypothetical protein